MDWLRVAAFVLGGLAAVLGRAGSVWAQSATADTVLARFQEAAALDTDPAGRLYVADAGRDHVRIVNPDGTVHATLGGPGTRAGEFDEPLDLDPTNGQTLLVADAGNGRIQRFSAELQYLEAMPVDGSFGRTDQRGFDDGRDGSTIQGSGRPSAVASSDGNATFVINARDNVVVAYDEQRAAERIIDRQGRLREPVALALDGSRRLYVADRERGAVFAYDLFGTFVRRLDLPPLGDLQALALHRRHLWVVAAGQVTAWHIDTGTTQQHPIDLATPLVDAAWGDTGIFLLTTQRLVRRESW